MVSLKSLYAMLLVFMQSTTGDKIHSISIETFLKTLIIIVYNLHKCSISLFSTIGYITTVVLKTNLLEFPPEINWEKVSSREYFIKA